MLWTNCPKGHCFSTILSLGIFFHSKTAASIFSRHWIPKLYRKSLRDGHKNHRHEWLYLGASRCTMMFSTLCSTRLRPSPQWGQKLKRFLSCNVLLWPLQSEINWLIKASQIRKVYVFLQTRWRCGCFSSYHEFLCLTNFSLACWKKCLVFCNGRAFHLQQGVPRALPRPPLNPSRDPKGPPHSLLNWS